MAISTKMQFGIVLVTGGMVMILGIFVGISLISRPLRPVAKSNLLAEEGSVRKPSAVLLKVKAEVLLESNNKKISKFKLNCINKKIHRQLKSTAKQIQLSGRLCDSGELISAEVINRTNGHRATVFNLKNNRIITDFINLTPGENKVIITIENTEGEKKVSSLDIISERLSPE